MLENFIKTLLYRRPSLSFQLVRKSFNQELSTIPAWASFTTTFLIKHKQLSDWCSPKENVFVYRGSGRRYGHNPYLRVGGIPPHDKQHHRINSKILEFCTLPMNQNVVQTGILIAWSPKCLLNSSGCNFAFLSSEHISDFVSNQDRL